MRVYYPLGGHLVYENVQHTYCVGVCAIECVYIMCRSVHECVYYL